MTGALREKFVPHGENPNRMQIGRSMDKGPCQKKTYRTKRKAVVALDRIRAFNGRQTDLPKHVYKCSRCGFWHHTMQEPSDRRARS